MQLIVQLYEIGALIHHGCETRIVSGFAHPQIHVEMLNDAARTSGYLDAIAAQILPNQSVLEIGTGTGILLASASKLGAKPCLGIEASDIANAAQQLFDAQEEPPSLVRAWSTQVENSQRFDWVISELLGNEPFGEQMVKTLLDAQQRFADSNTRWLPAELSIYARPFKASQQLLNRLRFTEENTAAWSAQYGIPLDALLKTPSHQALSLMLHPKDLQALELSSERLLLREIRFGALQSEVLGATKHRFPVTEPERDGYLLEFELLLSSAPLITTGNLQANQTALPPWHRQHWRIPGLLLPSTAHAKTEIEFLYEPGIGLSLLN